jgi:transcriptional regulator with XRE-family HTH domain
VGNRTTSGEARGNRSLSPERNDVGDMGTRRRSAHATVAKRTLQPLMTAEGAKIRRARKRKRWTQASLGARIGLAQPTISDLERGEGANLSVLVWQEVASLLGLNFDLSLGRDPFEEPADAGHLGIQELILRLGRQNDLKRTFELPTKPADPQFSTDVGLIDDLNRSLVQVECVNTFGKINAAIRSSDRKRAEAEAHAIATGQGEPYSVHQVWVIRATRRNRELLARYPELFATRFPASSRAWVDALTNGASPPKEMGLVWCDVAATRVFEWRPRESAKSAATRT